MILGYLSSGYFDMSEPAPPTGAQPPATPPPRTPTGPSPDGLFGPAISLATTEVLAVWARYSGFIFINGFLVNAVSRQFDPTISSSDANLIGLVGLLGLVINAIWFLLNFSGWLNQNLFFFRCFERFGDVGVISVDFNRLQRPWGAIYWIAQAMPITFSIGSTACIGFFLSNVMDQKWWVAFISIAAWLVAALVVFLLANIIARMGETGRPV
jgi:hypothetical protein